MAEEEPPTVGDEPSVDQSTRTPLYKHWGMWGVVGTVFFGILTIYFWWTTRKVWEINYVVEAEAAQVIDADALVPALRVVRPNGDELGESVYLSRVRLWNSGTESIDSDDVRDVLILQIEPVQEVLSATIDRQAREVDNIRVSDVFRDASDSLLWNIQIEWDYLDPFPNGSGAVIDVVHFDDSVSIEAIATIAKGSIAAKKGGYNSEKRGFTVYFIPMLWLLYALAFFINEIISSIYNKSNIYLSLVKCMGWIVFGAISAYLSYHLMLWSLSPHEIPMF